MNFFTWRFGADESLEQHDKVHHPNGYKEGDTCKLRDDVNKQDKESPEESLSESDGFSSEEEREKYKKIREFIQDEAYKFVDPILNSHLTGQTKFASETYPYSSSSRHRKMKKKEDPFDISVGLYRIREFMTVGWPGHRKRRLVYRRAVVSEKDIVSAYSMCRGVLEKLGYDIIEDSESKRNDCRRVIHAKVASPLELKKRGIDMSQDMKISGDALSYQGNVNLQNRAEPYSEKRGSEPSFVIPGWMKFVATARDNPKFNQLSIEPATNMSKTELRDEMARRGLEDPI